MNRWRWTLLLAVSLLLLTPLPSQAERHGGHGGHGGGHSFHGHSFPGGHGHFHGGGPRFFAGPIWPAPWWYYPPPAYAYQPPPVIIQPAPVYVAPPPPPQYWYLCQSFNAYYPQTPTCPEPWVMVPARPY